MGAWDVQLTRMSRAMVVLPTRWAKKATTSRKSRRAPKSRWRQRLSERSCARLTSHVEQGPGCRAGAHLMVAGADYTAGVRVRYAALRPPLTPARRPEGPTGT